MRSKLVRRPTRGHLDRYLPLVLIDRRSQRYFSDSISVSASASATEDDWDEFDDDRSVVDMERDVEGPQDGMTRTYDPNAVVGNLQWDEDLTPGPSTSVGSFTAPRRFLIPMPQHTARRTTEDTVVPIVARHEAREDTPLLHRATSLTFSEPARRDHANENVLPVIAMPIDGPPTTLTRRASQASIRQRRGSAGSRVTKGVQAGQSTFGQTV